MWYAVNRTGSWSLENKTTGGIPTSISLCLAFKIGTITSQNWAAFKTTLGGVPSSGQPSVNTQEAFTCRIWVKDALLALHNASIICLAMAIRTIEEKAIEAAERNRQRVEGGSGRARVWNNPGFATTC